MCWIEITEPTYSDVKSFSGTYKDRDKFQQINPSYKCISTRFNYFNHNHDSNNVIIPFNMVTTTIDSDIRLKIRVYTMYSTSITLGSKDGPNFLEEYTAWLDSQEQSLI